MTDMVVESEVEIFVVFSEILLTFSSSILSIIIGNATMIGSGAALNH